MQKGAPLRKCVRENCMFVLMNCHLLFQKFEEIVKFWRLYDFPWQGVCRANLQHHK